MRTSSKCSSCNTDSLYQNDLKLYRVCLNCNHSLCHECLLRLMEMFLGNDLDKFELIRFGCPHGACTE
jgi:hypothetical protein